MIFRNAAHNRDGLNLKLGDYYPYHGGHNPDFDEWSQRILNLKSEKLRSRERGLAFFYPKVNALLGTGFAIAVVPSHDPTHLDSGIRALAKQLCTSGRTNATPCLQRHTLIPKLAHGGDRDIKQHLNSIRLARRWVIEGQEVLLLDDVATTGHSLEACRQILKEGGAALVVALVLGWTV